MKYDKTERKKFTFEEKQKILEKTNNRCAHCGIKLDQYSMTVEHILPLSKCGNHNEYNLVALCEDCNENKSQDILAINDYYHYILPEYRDKFIDELTISIHEKGINEEKIFKFDNIVYNVLTLKAKQVLAQQAMRKKKIDKNLAQRLLTSFIMTKAYPGDAEDIVKLIESSRKRNSTININYELFKNEACVLHAIYTGEVYVIRQGNYKGEIHGVLIFEKVDSEKLNFIQIQNIEEETSLKIKHMMTLLIVDKIIEDVYMEIVGDVFSAFYNNNAIPIFFEMVKDDELFGISKWIKLPYSINDINGEVQFMSVRTMKNEFKSTLRERCMDKEDGEYNEDALDKMADLYFSKDEDSNNFIYNEEWQKTAEELGIKLRQRNNNDE